MTFLSDFASIPAYLLKLHLGYTGDIFLTATPTSQSKYRCIDPVGFKQNNGLHTPEV